MSIHLFADFNNSTEDHKVRLHTVGSLRDIEKHQGDMVEGMNVILSDGQVEVEARLERDLESGIWLGVPDWSTHCET